MNRVISISFLMSSSGNNVIWVRLVSNMWWPAQYLQNDLDPTFDGSSNSKVVKLLGINKITAIDTSKSDNIRSHDPSMVPTQEIPEHLQSVYKIAVDEISMTVEPSFKLLEDSKCFPCNYRKRKHSISTIDSIYCSQSGTPVTLNNIGTNPILVTPDEKNLPPLRSTAVTKRQDVLKWDDYFMAVAFLSAMRSKDPSTQVGACIVNPDKRIVGIGYNGFPRGCSDDELPWAREADDELDTKYPYVCHAEVNAILNKNSAEVRGCTIYVALFPCNECAKVIIQSGISEVVYLSDKYHDSPSMRASRRMLDMAKVQYRKHEPDTPAISIRFDSIMK